jgi:tetratricopeptide (TPR) repeat protein
LPVEPADVSQHVRRISIEKTSLLKFESGVPKALVAICHTATSVAAERRYSTALALADDVQRYLANEPIRVMRDSIATRCIRWMQKNPIKSVASGVSSLLLLVFSMIGMTVMANFNQRLEESNTRLAVAKRHLERANDAEVKARFRAELGFDAAREAVERFLVNVTEDERLISFDFSDLRQEFLESAKPFFENLRDQEPGDAHVEASRANAYLRLAIIQQETGKLVEAQANYSHCISAYEALVKNHSGDPKYRVGMSDCLHRHGNLLDQHGLHDDARELYRRVFELREQLALEFPQNPEFLQALADINTSLGLQAKSVGNLADAKEMLEKALEIEKRLSLEAPLNSEFRSSMAKSHCNLGLVLGELDDHSSAQENLKAAVAIQDQLAEEFPDKPAYRRALALSLLNLGLGFVSEHDLDAAVENLEKAVETQKLLAESFPSLPMYRVSLATGYHNLAGVLVAKGQIDNAKELFQRALAIREALVENFPGIPAYAVSLGGSYCAMGYVDLKSDETEKTLEWFAKAETVLNNALNGDPRNTTARQFLSQTYSGRAGTLNKMKRYREASEQWRAAAKFDQGGRVDFYLQQAAASDRAARNNNNRN